MTAGRARKIAQMHKIVKRARRTPMTNLSAGLPLVVVAGSSEDPAMDGGGTLEDASDGGEAIEWLEQRGQGTRNGWKCAPTGCRGF